MNRRTPPRKLAHDPEAWPDSSITDPAAAVVQHIARTLQAAMEERGGSLRRFAAALGVNRQVVADLVAGRSWPDIATVARLENVLDIPLYPPGGGTLRTHEKSAFPHPKTSSGTPK
ncbi:helix-turn-helix domain-containing protein [Streptomyces sp. 6N223]|uniref:helix-turn-helix domain-containing protein n=1 Tax=Streptomyces sp. 6N223 TaxID=3457412 RepID=UPI003FD37E44